MTGEQLLEHRLRIVRLGREFVKLLTVTEEQGHQ